MRRTGRRIPGRVVCGLVLFVAFLAAASGAVAADLSITAEVRETTVAVGAELVLTVVVQGSGMGSLPEPVLPQIAGAAVYAAGTSTSISTSLVNGRFTSQNAATHNYVVVPENEGSLVIGPITVTSGDVTHQTAPITVTVTAAGASSPAPRQESRPTARSEGAGGRDVFVELVADRTKAYVNQQLLLTFRFYTRVNLMSQPEYVPPVTTGFWVESLPKEPSYETMVDGTRYLVIEVRSAVFPTRSGTLTIEPATLRCVVAEPDRFMSRDPFDRFRRDFFGMGGRGREVELTTDPVVVEVLPLPTSGVPASFGGAVGDYRMTLTADRTSVQQGNPITLTMTISGRGNINTVTAPVLPDVPGLRAYDSGSRVNSSGSREGLQGEKIYERVVVPEVSGNFTLGPAEFTYFDPGKGRFETLTEGPISLSVAPGPISIGSQPEVPDRQEVRVLSRDILHIHTGRTHLERPATPLHRSAWFLGLQILPLAAYVTTLAHRRHRARLTGDVRYARARRADGLARRRFTEARRRIEDPTGLEFYGAVDKAARDFVGDKWNLATLGMTHDEIESNLQSRGVPHMLIRELTDVLRACDEARFCPAGETGGRSDLLRRAEGVVSRLGRCKV